MKSLLVILAILAFAAAHHHEGHENYILKTKDDLIKYRDTCAKKLNLADELVEKYKKWEYPDDRDTQCYMKCVFEQFGFFDEAKGFDVESVHHQLLGPDGKADHSDELHGKIERCAEKKPEYTDGCAYAYGGGMCFMREHLPLVKESVKA